MNKILKRLFLVILTSAVIYNSFSIGIVKNQIEDLFVNDYWEKFQREFNAQITIKYLTLYAEYIQQLAVVPNFTTLKQGTVEILFNGGLGAGVCISEDENYYYILTAAHVVTEVMVKNNNYKYSEYSFVPESNLGMYVSLNTINQFLKDKIDFLLKLSEANITVKNYKGIMVAAEKIYINIEKDLAYLRVNKMIDLSVLSFAQTGGNIGDEVYSLGHPLAFYYNVSKGVISNFYGQYIVADCLTTFGNSGGGLFNRCGEIIGIASQVAGYEITIDKEK